MKHQSKLLLTLLHGAGIGAVAISGGSLFSTDAHAGISNTRHNLGSTNVLGASANKTSAADTGEVCVFCHTPHASSTATNAPPLWNKNLPGSSYTMYATAGSSTLDANNNNGSLPAGSTSLACLSCHDGTQAMDNIINAPGSGGFTANGGGAGGLAYSWTGTGVNAAGNMTGAATNLGTDLRNDHPIGIAYCGGNTGNYVDNTTNGCRDGDFKAVRSSTVGAATANTQFYVDTNASGTRDKSDMYLYTRDFGAGAFKPSVECGSCHDPHVETKASTQVSFLRVSQTSSGLCLSCHNK